MANNAKIGVATATIIGMNAMIGSGIFTAPAALASGVGPAGILAYIFVVISIWFMAQSLAQLARLFPQEGSFYTFAKQWGGHTVGVIAAGAYLFGLIIAMGLLAQMAGTYLHVFFPNVSANTLGIIALATLVILNLFGAVLSELGQRILICTTIFPLITLTIMGLTKINLANLTPFAPYGMTNVLKATRVVIFGFFGFECAASLFNIVENPKRNVPRALTYSIMIVGSIYILFVGSLILSVPLEYFTDPRTPLPETLKILFPNGSWIITINNFAILSAIIGTIHSMIWSSSSLLVSFVKKLKSSIAKKINTTLTHQHAVLFVGAAIFTSYTTLKNIDLFFNLTALFIVSAYVLSMITLLTMPDQWKSRQNVKTILGIVTASMIFIFAAQGLVEELAKLI